MKELWNDRYAKKEFLYGRAPNDFIKRFLDNDRPGSILFPCEGEGRNAVYAARKGWDVYAVDYSDIAREKALKWAELNMVNLRYDVADLNEWECDVRFDSIALLYAHFHPENREILHRKFISLLKPNGRLILQCFSKKQVQYDSGGPSNPDFLYDTQILKEDFKELTIEFLQERVVNLNEGLGHRGEGSILRMIGIKS